MVLFVALAAVNETVSVEGNETWLVSTGCCLMVIGLFNTGKRIGTHIL